MNIKIMPGVRVTFNTDIIDNSTINMGPNSSASFSVNTRIDNSTINMGPNSTVFFAAIPYVQGNPTQEQRDVTLDIIDAHNNGVEAWLLGDHGHGGDFA